jgi:cell wall-associated NlpC family hydrolase
MRAGASLKAGVLLVVALLAVAPSSALADPVPAPVPTPSPASLKDAKAQVKDLEDKAASVEEDYEEAKLRLEASEQRVGLLRQDISAQQGKVAQISEQARVIALMRFQGRDLDTTVQIFTASDPDAFLGQLSTANKVDENMNATLQELQAQQAKLSDLEWVLNAEVKSAEAEKVRLAELDKQLASQLQAAKKIVDDMTAAEQAALFAQEGASVTFDPSSELGGVNERIKRVIQYAVGHVPGAQYVRGASGPKAFDCSGFTLASYRAAGISLPHSSRAQAGVGRSVSRSELKPGDLIFWYHPIHHVGLYIGNGKIAHARNPRADLVIQTLNSYPAPWAGARRVIG